MLFKIKKVIKMLVFVNILIIFSGCMDHGVVPSFVGSAMSTDAGVDSNGRAWVKCEKVKCTRYYTTSNGTRCGYYYTDPDCKDVSQITGFGKKYK